MASQQQLVSQSDDPFASLAQLGVVIPHRLAQPTLLQVPVADTQIAPVAADESMAFDLSLELGRVISEHDRMEAYEASLLAEFEAARASAVSEAETELAARTQIVLSTATQECNSWRQQLHNEWRSALVTTESNIETVASQANYAFSIAESHLQMQHRQALELAMQQQHEAYDVRDLEARTA